MTLFDPSCTGSPSERLPVMLNGCPEERIDIVGPVWRQETFLDVVVLPRLAAGALIAIGCAGAYGRVMSSNYNSRLLGSNMAA